MSRRMRAASRLGCLVGVALGALGGTPAVHGAVPWRDVLRQSDAWYATPEAVAVGERVLLYQRARGGWPKNIDMAAPLSAAERTDVDADRSKADGTIDNGATTTQIQFLARLQTAQPEPRWRSASERGLDFLLAAQYPNGGWPQIPGATGYSRHITFNDDAMVRVLVLLRDVARGQPPFAWLDANWRDRARLAVERGVDCILRTQVEVDGRHTVWCAQHDAVTLQPAAARSYELVSLSGSESVGIVRFLMAIEAPPPPVVDAIDAAVAWFRKAQLDGLRLEQRPDASSPRGWDRVVVADPAAPPVWARFYEIDSGRPFFCGRDGVKKYSLAEIEVERRTGYSWYTTAPATLLSRDYPEWQARRTRRAETASPPKQDDGLLRLGLVTVDPTAWIASFPARVNMATGLVEYVVVTEYGKTHESILATDARPSDVQAALLLLGAEPTGTNGLALKPGIVPPGSAVELSAAWPAGPGSARRTRRFDELCALGTGGWSGTITGRLTPGPWLFNGSQITAEGFAAHFEGSIVSLIADSSAILNNPGLDRDDDDIHLVAPSVLPPPGTAVTVEMKVRRPPPGGAFKK